MKDLRIIYMGTPDFAVPSLDILVENGFNVVAVITAPDKPAGRGLQLKQSPVKEAAVRHNIPVLQPTNLKDPDFLEELASYNANLQIVVAFRMLPEAVWNMPEIGTFNLHASLLPNYRGAAPINWAVINGEKKTGCTTFFLKHEIDTGNIILQDEEDISDSDTAGTLYNRLMQKGAKLVLKTVELIRDDRVSVREQVLTGSEKSAPKIFRQDCKIDWSKSAEEVYNFVRGLSPYPGAWTTVNGKNCKIFGAAISDRSIEQGEVTSDNKEYLAFGAAQGSIDVTAVQIEGKKRMTTSELLRGFKV